MLLAYRYMKEKLKGQDVAEVLYVPEGEILRRFGFGIAVNKILKAHDSIHTLFFKVLSLSFDHPLFPFL